MRAPIVVADDDIDVFERVEDAERYLEAQDVRRGRAKIYDRDGRPIRALIVRKVLAEVVKLEDQEQAEPEREELRSILLKFLKGIETVPMETNERTSIDELLNRALKHKTR
jgi:hypothetical protein